MRRSETPWSHRVGALEPGHGARRQSEAAAVVGGHDVGAIAHLRPDGRAVSQARGTRKLATVCRGPLSVRHHTVAAMGLVGTARTTETIIYEKLLGIEPDHFQESCRLARIRESSDLATIPGSENLNNVLPVSLDPGMLTERQLAVLRASPGTNRVATAISLAGVTQVTVAEAIGVTQAYVSDVARQRYSTITVSSARKFSRFFGCSIDDLFPPGDEGDE